MARHVVNFSEWLHRLGFKTGVPPDLIRAVQPVQIVQDATRIVSPIEFARGTCGFLSPTVALNTSYLRLRSSRPFLAHLSFIHNSTGPGAVRAGVFTNGGGAVNPGGVALVADTAHPIQNEGPEPLAAIFSSGSFVGLHNFAAGAQLYFAPFANSVSPVSSDFFVPPGRALWLVKNEVAGGLSASIGLAEFPNIQSP